MEKIELVVTHQIGGPVDRVWSAVFGMAGGTIGRAGQNKLVLPDADAAVARVHAMVRLDSDQAYIANLCERRSVVVDGQEVLSGQEVPLLPGAEIGIGPYQLKTVIPGAPQRNDSARRDSQPANGSGSLPPQPPCSAFGPALATTVTTELNLASLPNPWADIPTIVGKDAYSAELAHLQTPGAQDYSEAKDDPSDNPFAILGRIESPDSAGTAQEHRPQIAVKTEKREEGEIPAGVAPKPGAARPAAEHAWVAASPPQRPAPLHRAMVIPDDFDPFAADPKAASNPPDVWSGDLTAKSLEEVVQLKHDELLLSLPSASQFAGTMDNAAHTGLPKALEPNLELNPLKLFREPGEAVYSEVADHGLSRGSDLAQVFSMPREVPQGLRSDHTEPNDGPSQVQSRASEGFAVAAGLRPTQGLDLGLFGSAATPSASDLVLLGSDIQPTTGVAQHPQDVPEASKAPEALPAPQAPPMDTVAFDALRGASPQQPALRVDRASETPINREVGASHGVVGLNPAHPAPEPSTAQKPPEGTGAPSDLSALTAAFLEGAGIAPGRVNLSLTPEFMRCFGEALHIAVQGSIDLLSARSEIKREFRADVTIIASGANNPLKFLPTAEGVMLQLTGQSFPGFMKPVPAMKEAYNDLAVHQIALMAGIRAAYAEATARLSPAEMEKNAAASAGFLAKVSTIHRKAALWDDYQQRYESIRRHAEDDLMAFSGKTFVEAYEHAALTAEGKL